MALPYTFHGSQLHELELEHIGTVELAAVTDTGSIDCGAGADARSYVAKVASTDTVANIIAAHVRGTWDAAAAPVAVATDPLVASGPLGPPGAGNRYLNVYATQGATTVSLYQLPEGV